MSAFQPGPWYATVDNEVFAKCQMQGDDPMAEDDMIAEVSGCGPDAETARANARLIAAAPLMRALLGKFIEAYGASWTDGLADEYFALITYIDGEAPP